MFLNITGKVVYIEEKADDVSFAYIVNYNRENSMDTSVLLRLYEGVTQLTTVTLADKVKIDGKIYKVNRIKLAGEKGADGDIFLAKEQLVVLKKNSGNKVISIDTINKGTGGDDDKLLVTASGSHRYKRSSGNFGGKAFVTDNSKIFGVPSDKNEEKGYGVYKPDQLINDAIYKMIAYSVDDKALLSAAVVFEATEEEGGINDETGLAVVKNLVDILDSDGNQKKQISMLFEGTDIAKVITDTYKIEDIKIGDTIRFGTDMSGEINKIEKIYDVETGMAKGNPIGNFISCFGVTAGTVTRKGGEFITVARTNDPSDISMHYATRHKIYVVNMGLRETTVTSGNINDIKDAKLYGDEASIAVVHARFGDPKTIVVYNK
ncbi:MAG: hypothetical protein RR957_06130 [Oscillospiraceae bacterium]